MAMKLRIIGALTLGLFTVLIPHFSLANNGITDGLVVGPAWTFSLQPNLPTQPTSPSPAPVIAPRSVILMDAQNPNARSVSGLMDVRQPFLQYIPGPSALRQTLAADSLNTSHCECVVHHKNEPNTARRIGTVFAHGMTADMSRGLAEASCGREAIRMNTRLAPEAKIDWFTTRSCQYSRVAIPPALRASLGELMSQIDLYRERQPSEGEQLRRRVAAVIQSGFSGGFLWRARGGGIHLDSTTASRVVFVGLGFALVGAVTGLILDDWQASIDGAIAGLLMLPGSALVGYHGNLDLTRGDRSERTVYMMGNGIARMALPAAYLHHRGYNVVPMIIGGAGMGPCYNLTARHLSESGGNRFFDGHTAYAEACAGASFAASTAVVLASRKQTIRPEFLATDTEAALRDPSFQRELRELDNTPLQIVSITSSPGNPAAAAPVLNEIEARAARVCELAKANGASFSISSRESSEMGRLLDNSRALRERVCALTQSPGERGMFAPPCSDPASVLANHHQAFCRGLGVRL
jgi:hypothetical protein